MEGSRGHNLSHQGSHISSKSNSILSLGSHSILSFKPISLSSDNSMILSFDQDPSFKREKEMIGTLEANFLGNFGKQDEGFIESKREEEIGWFCKEEMVGALKRSNSGDGSVSSKRYCASNHDKSKSKNTASKDPQSLAAKNRRERISERLRILQDLVPNGSKVDLVTMLEKAINYVKFLQLQVKVLAADEFWPPNGGKVPELGQVKEVIDTILSSHKESNHSYKSGSSI